MEQQLALVVGRAAGAQHVAVDGGLERVGVPQLERVDGLDVVVGVHEDGRGIGVAARPLGEHRGQPRAVVPHLDRGEAGAPGGVGEPGGAAGDVRVPLGLGADAGDAQPLIEIGEQVVAVLGDEVSFGAHPPDDNLRRWTLIGRW